MKFTKSIQLLCLLLCLLEVIIAFNKIQHGSKNYLKLKANRIKKLNNSKSHSSNKDDIKTLENFLKETLLNFKNKNELYEKIDPTGKISDGNKWGIIYKPTKDLNDKNQFFNDIVMIYETLYPENDYAHTFFNNQDNNKDKDTQTPQSPSQSPAILNKSIMTSFKRILFSMIDQGLYYSREENKIFKPEERKDENLWKYPLASSVCHGSRTIFLFNKEKMGGEKSFPSYFFGDKNNLLKPRSTASHKMTYDPHSGKFEEKKILIEAALDFGKSIIRSDLSPHYGMNIPLGGIGNIWPDKETIIDSQGFGLKTQHRKDHDKDPLQAGHLYVRIDSLEGSPYASIMVGLEEESPDFKGMFSSKVHNLFNAFKAPSISVCGGSKWKALGEHYLHNDVPANYGGKVVYFDEYPKTDILNKIESFKEDLAKKVWWIILSSDSKMYRLFNENYLKKMSEAELETKLKNVIQ
jgi:hypothetical protein